VTGRGRPVLPRGVYTFDAPTWQPPQAVVLDTSVVVEALLPNQPEHRACLGVLDQLAAARSTVLYKRLLEIELWEATFNLALRERHPRKNLRQIRYDNRIRPRAARLLRQAHQAWQKTLATLTSSTIEVSEVAGAVPRLMQEYGLQSYDAVHAATLLATGITDLLTRDAGFATLPPRLATLHTTHARLAGTRARRRRAGVRTRVKDVLMPELVDVICYGNYGWRDMVSPISSRAEPSSRYSSRSSGLDMPSGRSACRKPVRTATAREATFRRRIISESTPKAAGPRAQFAKSARDVLATCVLRAHEAVQ